MPKNCHRKGSLQEQGTQNYTCANGTAAPVSIGAVATLTNASCAVAGGASEDQLGSINEGAAAIGAHFFVDASTPDFDVDELGNTELTKANVSSAPPNSDGDVPWLRLTAHTAGTTSSITEIYRLETSGGAAPATCGGTVGVLTVKYSAEYWLYAAA